MFYAHLKEKDYKRLDRLFVPFEASIKYERHFEKYHFIVRAGVWWVTNSLDGHYWYYQEDLDRWKNQGLERPEPVDLPKPVGHFIPYIGIGIRIPYIPNILGCMM